MDKGADESWHGRRQRFCGVSPATGRRERRVAADRQAARQRGRGLPVTRQGANVAARCRRYEKTVGAHQLLAGAGLGDLETSKYEIMQGPDLCGAVDVHAGLAVGRR